VTPIAKLIGACTGFQWDSGNTYKNELKHKVSRDEAEQVFNCELVKFVCDRSHSKTEPRYGVYGKTDAGRCLFVVFTVRHKLIRVISARDQNREERQFYGQE